MTSKFYQHHIKFTLVKLLFLLPPHNLPVAALLKEVDSLNQEKRELAEQLQHQLDLSRRRLTELEALAEDAERRHEIQLEERSRQVEDLRLQLDNTERQLKASKAFVAVRLVLLSTKKRYKSRIEILFSIDKCMKANISISLKIICRFSFLALCNG